MLGEAGKKPVNPTAKKPAAKKKLRAGESEEFPGYFWRGGIYYSNVSKTGQVTHKKDKGRMVVLTNQEKAEYRAKRAGKSPAKPAPQAQPATQGYGKDFIGGLPGGAIPQRPSLRTPAKPKVDTKQTIDDLEANASNRSLGEEKRRVARELVDAMKSGNVERIRKVIKDNGIIVGSSGRLKSDDTGKKGFLDEELSLKVFMALQKMGVTLTLKGGKPVDVDKLIAAVSGEKRAGSPFKPQNTFGEVDDVLDVEDITRDAEGNVTGCTVEGERLDKITPDEENRLVEERVSQARQRFGGEMSEEQLREFEQNVEEYVRARIREQNANIDWLVEVHEQKGGLKYLQFPKKGETTESATARMVTKLGELVDAHITDPTKREAARTALDDMATHAAKMRTAKTREERREAAREYNAALSAFQTAAEGSELGKSMTDVGESLVALRSVALGKTVLIPDAQNFPLADVITIGKNPVTGESSIELFVVDVDAQESISVADSVKVGRLGNAGVTYEKDAHSEFGPVRGPGGSVIPGEEVKIDLIAMGGDRKKEIFTRDGQLSKDAKDRIIADFEKYGDVAREYFGLPTDPNAEGYLNAEQLYEFLSYGTALTCVDGKPAHGPMLAAGDASRGSQNPEQWKASNALGMLHEAVHNRTVTQQYYRTTQIKRSGMVIADGIRTRSKAVFQPYKTLVSGTERSPRVGKAPDSSMVAFSVPAEEKQLRSGNPCNEE